MVKKIFIAVTIVAAPLFVFASFDRDLSFGMRDASVRTLQQFLKDQGPSVYPEGLVTGYFGKATLAAVKKFQTAHQITPVAGYFGPKTRNIVNSILAVQSPAPAPAPTPSPQPAPTQPLAFLKTPRAITNFSEVRIVDADANKQVGYVLVCDHSVYPSPSGGLLTFRVEPHAHYNCQLTAKDINGITISQDISFDTQEWFDISAIPSSVALGTVVPFGTVTFTNKTSQTITVNSVPLKLSWYFITPYYSTAPNLNTRISLIAKNSDGVVIGRNDIIADALQKAVTFNLNVGSPVLASDQQFKISFSLENLSAPLGVGEWASLESASTSVPATISPNFTESNAFSFRRAP